MRMMRMRMTRRVTKMTTPDRPDSHMQEGISNAVQLNEQRKVNINDSIFFTSMSRENKVAHAQPAYTESNTSIQRGEDTHRKEIL